MKDKKKSQLSLTHDFSYFIIFGYSHDEIRAVFMASLSYHIHPGDYLSHHMSSQTTVILAERLVFTDAYGLKQIHC
jgi:hypothetical protein